MTPADLTAARELAQRLQGRVIITDGLPTFGQEVAALLTRLADEVEALRKDAARYRWVLENMDPFDLALDYPMDWETQGDEIYKAQIDAEIDAAMKEQSNG